MSSRQSGADKSQNNNINPLPMNSQRRSKMAMFDVHNINSHREARLSQSRPKKSSHKKLKEKDDPKERSKESAHSAEKVEVGSGTINVSPLLDDPTHKDTHGTHDDSFEEEKGMFDLSKVDMRKYRSLNYETLHLPKNKLFKDVWAMFKGSNVADVFEIVPSTFSNFIEQTYAEYEIHQNPFHNFRHAVTVMNVCYFFLKEGTLSLYFDSLSVAALIFSSLMHDIAHTGHNNAFEESYMSSLAITYNDTSILEMHHCATAFNILLKRECNIFQAMDKEDYFSFRKYVIRGILATDIKFHLSDLGKLQASINNTSFKPYVNSQDLTDFLLLFGVLVHCADLYTPTKPHPYSIEWARLLNEEFINQTRLEEELGLPVYPFYANLSNPKEMAISEKKFISFIIRPLWTEVDRFFEGKLSEHIANIDKSHAFWDEVERGLKKVEAISILDHEHSKDDDQKSEKSSASGSIESPIDRNQK